MANVSIDKYCADPQEYTNSLPQATKDYYNSICVAKSNISNSWKEQTEKLGLTIVEFPFTMLQSILSPEGLKLLSIFVGVDLTGKAALNGIYRTIASGIGPEVMEAATEMAAETGASFVNNAILTSVLANAIEEGTFAARAFMITSMIAEMASATMTILTIVQILGAIIDAWDPEGYGNELDADTLDIIVDGFNDQFMTTFLSDVTSGKDEFGRPTKYNVWPVEFYADYIIGDAKKDVYDKKMFLYMTEYLQNLKVNSDGDAIAWPTNTELIKPSVFDQYANQYSMIIADKNTIVANWVRKYWLILLTIAIIIVIILLFLK